MKQQPVQAWVKALSGLNTHLGTCSAEQTYISYGLVFTSHSSTNEEARGTIGGTIGGGQARSNNSSYSNSTDLVLGIRPHKPRLPVLESPARTEMLVMAPLATERVPFQARVFLPMPRKRTVTTCSILSLACSAVWRGRSERFYDNLQELFVKLRRREKNTHYA